MSTALKFEIWIFDLYLSWTPFATVFKIHRHWLSFAKQYVLLPFRWYNISVC
jgi:hypothetical protein